MTRERKAQRRQRMEQKHAVFNRETANSQVAILASDKPSHQQMKLFDCTQDVSWEGLMIRSAVITNNGQYRYLLSRVWDDKAADATFIMLNPSIADATTDDNTIRRCIGFARSWGCGGIQVVNLYALRSTDPEKLWSAEDPVGPGNDYWILLLALQALKRDLFVAAWGAHDAPFREERIGDVTSILKEYLDEPLYCLGTTKEGYPKHPLRLRSDTKLEIYV